MKGLTAGPSEIPAGLLHEPGLASWLVKHGKALAPLVIWLHVTSGSGAIPLCRAAGVALYCNSPESGQPERGGRHP